MDIGKIEHAVRTVSNQTSFIKNLLCDGLDWPIDRGIDKVEDIAYGWSKDDLQIEGMDKHFVDGQIWQIQPLEAGRKQPWGIFLLEFTKPDVFTSGRGITGPLRRILRRLVPKRRQQPNHAVWDRKNLLFICTHKYEHFSIAYFKEPPEGSKTAPLAIFGWGPDIPSRTAVEFNLPALDWPDEGVSPDQWVANWSVAFDVEKVTSKFYEEYAEVFTEVEAQMPKSFAKGEERRLYTQMLMNRLMFLRFIERKGWLELGGNPNYLQELFTSTPPKTSFYKTRLRRLFFEGLALEKHTARDVIGDVPFLNGGLFEENPLDKKVDDIPNTAFEFVLGKTDGIFYHYNFTVEESTPLDIQVAVDPEMLGKVFEELVTGRHESGSYYTPRPVVSFMCREALKGYLANKTGASSEAIALLVDKHDVSDLNENDGRKVIEALDNVKAVDPACGSGAYLLGLLQEMVMLYRLLYSEKLTRDSRSLYELKLRIISNNLYGVDIDPFATNIAMLRLWLSIAVDSDKPVPLPNLDFKIETGESLLGPCEVPQGRLDLHNLRERADALVIQKDKFLKAYGSEKEKARDHIKRVEREIAKDIHGLHGEGSIDWRVQFAEVFAFEHGGFDIVLANPPYIDSETMTRTDTNLRKAIKSSYTMTKGNWDIYIAFYERGFRLLGNEGVLSFITPDKWISKPFGDELRIKTVENIVSILKAGREVFESSNVDAIVSVFTKTPQPFLRVYEYRDTEIRQKRTVRKNTMKPPYAYDWLFSDFVKLLTKLDAYGQTLSKHGSCENACATSDAYKLQDFIQEEPKDVDRNEYLRIINTGTIGKYVSKWGQREMVYLGRRYTRPVVKKKRFQEAFTKSYGKKAVHPKVIVKGLNLLDACLDADGTIIPGKTTLLIASDDVATLKLLLAILNSSVAFFYIKEKYPASSYNQGTTFTTKMINNLPIPKVRSEDCNKLVSIVERIIMAKRRDQETDTKEWEREIDQLVYAMYSLTPTEIKLVEGRNR